MRIDQNGAESTEVSGNGSFVLVQVPITILGETPKDGIGFRFSIGSFQGRETQLLIRNGAQSRLNFRIPKELFRPRERLRLEMVVRDDAGSETILWAKRYEAGWLGSVPHLEPMTDLLSEVAEEKL